MDVRYCHAHDATCHKKVAGEVPHRRTEKTQTWKMPESKKRPACLTSSPIAKGPALFLVFYANIKYTQSQKDISRNDKYHWEMRSCFDSQVSASVWSGRVKLLKK